MGERQNTAGYPAIAAPRRAVPKLPGRQLQPPHLDRTTHDPLLRSEPAQQRIEAQRKWEPLNAPRVGNFGGWYKTQQPFLRRLKSYHLSLGHRQEPQPRLAIRAA